MVNLHISKHSLTKTYAQEFSQLLIEKQPWRAISS